MTYLPIRRSYFVFAFALLSGATQIQAAVDVPLRVEDNNGYTRRAEAVSSGIPLPRGAVKDLSRLAVATSDGRPVPAQFESLATWPDGSVKWLLVDFIADCPANGAREYRLSDSAKRPEKTPPLSVEESAENVIVQTGVLRSVLDRKHFNLFDSVQLDHDRNGSFSETERITIPAAVEGIRLADSQGHEVSSKWGKIRSFNVEAKGPVRATVAIKGALADPDGERFLEYTLRLHFYAGSGLVRAFFTLENPDATVPIPGNNWVLGRPGSRYFKDLSLLTRLQFNGPIQMSVGDGPDDVLDRVVLTGKGGIYQDSSGGENWFHRTHMDNSGNIPLRFQGAKVFLNGVEPYARKRPDAWLHVADRQFGLAVTVRHFWQNFPKALSAEPDGSVRVALWPAEFSGLHELQGGEIKTHEIAFFFHTGPQGSTKNENRVATAMGAFHHPLFARAPAEWYLATGIFDDAVPYDPKQFPAYERYQQGAVMAQGNNYAADLEKVDEYGWRNFGDAWAKNELDETKGPNSGRLVVSHYNLEYDLGYGMLFQGLRTAGTPLSHLWWNLAEAALRHESDIDVYHNAPGSQARAVYNGGKFTHTAHGVEAGLSTHRGAPQLTWFGALRWPWGEGSAPESGHFNTRGQMCYYYLTGDRRVLESALEQTDLVYRKVSQNLFAQIDQLSREAANNLQILTDGYLLAWDEKYREAAEKILQSTAPEKQWFMTAEGREKNQTKDVSGFWTSALCIDEAARFTAVMEEKTGRHYEPGRQYVTQYADFVSRYLAGGPAAGFYSSWTPARGGRGDHGPWTYRIADIPMYGHKYSTDPEVKKRCLKASADAFAFMERRAPGTDPMYNDSKSMTMLISGGHEYTFLVKNGRWRE